MHSIYLNEDLKNYCYLFHINGVLLLYLYLQFFFHVAFK